MSEEQLNDLHRDIVAEVVGIKELGLKSENDMTCLFPSDMMKKGLGEEVIIEVFGLFKKTGRTTEVRVRLAARLTVPVRKILPKARIECFVSMFDPRHGFWSSPC
jgi:hypothetical protein